MSGSKKQSRRAVNKEVAQVIEAVNADNEKIAKEQDESPKVNSALEKAVKGLDKVVKKQAEGGQGVYVAMIQDKDGVLVSGGGSVESLSTMFASSMINNEMLKTALTQAVMMVEMDSMSEEQLDEMMKEIKTKGEA